MFLRSETESAFSDEDSNETDLEVIDPFVNNGKGENLMAYVLVIWNHLEELQVQDDFNSNIFHEFLMRLGDENENSYSVKLWRYTNARKTTERSRCTIRTRRLTNSHVGPAIT